MTRTEFELRLSALISLALKETSEGNPIDLRASREPYDVVEDNEIFDAYHPDYDEMYEWIKDADEWYIDIYENFNEENRAEFMDITLCSWE